MKRLLPRSHGATEVLRIFFGFFVPDFWKLCLCVSVVGIFVSGVGGAQTLAAAQLSTPLGALGASARADALGDALVGLADDPSALFFNSAGLGTLRNNQLSINHNSYLGGAFEETLLFGMPAGSKGGWGAAIQYVGWSDLDKRDAFGVPLGTFSDSEVGLSFGWGEKIFDHFFLGLALHGSQEKIVDSLYSQLSGDLGLLFSPSRDLKAGLALTGLSTDLQGFTQALDIHAGLSANLHLTPGASLLWILGGYWEPNGVSKLRCGLEGGLEGRYFLRVGYQAALSDNQIGGLTGLSAGAGLKIEALSLDYAFVPVGDLGTSHRISLGYEFPEPTPVAPQVITVVAPVTVVATPVPAAVSPGPPKPKVEVHFEIPNNPVPAGTQVPSAALLRSYEIAAQQNPNDARAWRNLGAAYFKAGKTALALQSLDQALRLDPNDVPLKKWLDDYRAKHPEKN